MHTRKEETYPSVSESHYAKGATGARSECMRARVLLLPGRPHCLMSVVDHFNSGAYLSRGENMRVFYFLFPASTSVFPPPAETEKGRRMTTRVDGPISHSFVATRPARLITSSAEKEGEGIIWMSGKGVKVCA